MCFQVFIGVFFVNAPKPLLIYHCNHKNALETVNSIRYSNRTVQSLYETRIFENTVSILVLVVVMLSSDSSFLVFTA